MPRSGMAYSKVYVFVGLFVILSCQVLAQSPLPPPPILEDPRPDGPKEIPFEALETVEAVNEMIHHDQNSGKMHKVMIPVADLMTFRANLIKKLIAETIPLPPPPILGKMHKVMIPAADWMTIRANLIKKKCSETIPNSRKFLKHLCEEEDKFFLNDEGNKVSKIDEEDKVSLSDRENKASKSGEEDKVFKSNEEDKVSINDEGDQVSKIDEEDTVSKNDKEDKVFQSDEED